MDARPEAARVHVTSAEPLRYPRIPHLPGSAAVSRDDLRLSGREADRFLASLVIVEEKLDGSSVALWLDAHDQVRVATRGGADAVDRAGQRGPLRAWAAHHATSLRPLLRSRTVLYGEWLWFTHTVRYTRLPQPFVGLDLRSGHDGFASVRERDSILAEAGLLEPPRLFQGVLESWDRLMSLLGESCFGDSPAEGVVVRRCDPPGEEPRMAKLVAPTFTRRDDAGWRGRPARNRLLPA